MTNIGEFTHKRVISIAFPMILSGLSVPLLGLVDTAVVGHLGAAAPIGAVAVGALILSTLYWAFGFLRMGVTGQTAQASGRGDRSEMQAILLRALVIGAAAGVLLYALQWPIVAAAFKLSPASAEVESLAQDYIAIRIWAAPAAISLFAINGWLIARERMRAVVGLQFWVNGTNIALDLIFVPGMGLGVSGVAWASLIAEISGIALGLWFCRDALIAQRPHWARIFDRRDLINMARLNGDIFGRNAILQLIFLAFMFTSAGQGDVLLAANQILLLILQTVAYGIDGVAFSAEVMVGHAVGVSSRASFRRAVRLNSAWSVGLAVFLALLIAVGGVFWIGLLTDIPDVRGAAVSYLPWLVVMPLFAAPAYFWDGVFTGATQTRAMLHMMIITGIGYFIALVVLPEIWGNHGLWCAMLVSFLLRSFTMTVCYSKIASFSVGP